MSDKRLLISEDRLREVMQEAVTKAMRYGLEVGILHMHDASRDALQRAEFVHIKRFENRVRVGVRERLAGTSLAIREDGEGQVDDGTL